MEFSAQHVVDFPAHMVVFGDDSLPVEHQPDALQLPEMHASAVHLALEHHQISALQPQAAKFHSQACVLPYHPILSTAHAELTSASANTLTDLNALSGTSIYGDCHSVDDSSAHKAPVLQSAPDEPPPCNAAVRRNVSHTRRCRAKVNSKFESLLQVLPEPPPGTEVRHKAQILQHAIDCYRRVVCKNRQLEMKLALRSPAAMHRWVQSVVSTAPILKDALKSFMAMICLTNNWKYAELWRPQTRAGTSSVVLQYVTGALPPTVGGETLQRLRTYRQHSRKYRFAPRSGVPGRVFLTRRPEWLPLLSDPVAFLRAPHAVRNGVQVTFAVPVIVNGSVQMVVEFFDTDRRDYDHAALNVANEMASVFGKAFSQLQTYACFL